MKDPGEVQRDEVREEVKGISEASRCVDNVTFEPEAVVESGGDFKETEVAEAARVEAVVAFAYADSMEAMPDTPTATLQAGDRVSQSDDLVSTPDTESGMVLRDPEGGDGTLEIDVGGFEEGMEDREP